MPVRIRKRRLAKGIYLLRFRTQYELTSTFLRVQEHYESPKFHGQIFTLEQYMDWYAAKRGKFSYYEDWAGFNVPSTAFRAFYDGKFDPLSEKEKQLLRLFKGLRERFYVIGVYDAGAKHSLRHELAHALYFIDDEYRSAVQQAMRRYNTRALGRRIARAGYAQHVIRDEIQAYIVQPSGELGPSRALKPLQRQLRALFRRHARKLGLDAIK